MSDTESDRSKPSRVRYGVLALLFAVTTISYADRSVFSFAGPAASSELGLGAIDMGYILSGFAWSYVAAQIPVGVLLDAFGVKRIYAAAIALWSVFTTLQGCAGWIGGLSVVASLFCLRLLVGVTQAPAFPANARIVAAWFPGAERGFASAVFNSAQYFALVLFGPLLSWLVHGFGWRSPFLVMGVMGVAAALAFAVLVRSPARHPKVSAAELDRIAQGGGLIHMDDTPRSGRTSGQGVLANFRLLFTNRMLLGIYIGQYGINVLTYFFVTWFPIYLVKARGLDIVHAGMAAAMPALAGFVGGLAGGLVSDRLLVATRSIDLARKIPILVGMVLAMAIVACAHVRDQALVIGLMSVAFFGKGVASLGWAVISEVSPRRMIGQAGGVFNMFGNAAGIVTPIVIGYLVAPRGAFDSALLFVGAHCLLVVVAFFVIAGRLKPIEGE